MGEWYRLNQVRLELDDDPADLPKIIGRKLGVDPGAIAVCSIGRKALDARGRQQPFFMLNVNFLWQGDPNRLAEKLNNDLKKAVPLQNPVVRPGGRKLASRPVIVGAGPAGLMAGLRLAEAGYRPLVLERGDGLQARIQAVEGFWRDGRLDPESNIQYGAGGAGTFSDGKLVTRIKDPLAVEVLSILTGLGGPEEIRYEAKPHVGTDRLRQMVDRWEEQICAAGGEIRYRTKVAAPVLHNGVICGVRLADGTELPTGVLVLATGHSARQLYAELHRQGCSLVAKPIAIGLRIEHPQELIDRTQYGRWAGHPRLGAADYRLTHHYASGNRGVYSFCMCPGGLVVAAASEPEGVVTNGMSFYARDTGVANAAIVATVRPEEYNGTDPVAGVAFQRYWERKAFERGGGDFAAPAQRVEDFLAKRISTRWTEVQPSYRPGVRPANLWECLPSFVGEAIADGLKRFERVIPGFVKQGVLTGVETRTSAPVRINRGVNFQALGVEGLFPCGEGSGYAGGIVSAAVDGLRAADSVIMEYAPFKG